MQLAPEEQREINRLVAETEARSGAQVLVVIVGKADAYPEIPWKAFSLGSAFAALVLILDMTQGGVADASPLVSMALPLAAGAALALLAILLPGLARLFVSRLRAQAEVRQYAEAAFLERGVCETRDRSGVLILIARFERMAVVLADSGVRRHVSEDKLDAAAAQMTPLVRRGRMAAACAAGLGTLTTLVAGALPRSSADELPGALFEERGA